MKSANQKSRIGFTIVELLVVITIIVVLLALLTPALDEAIYQAQLATCGANLKSIGSGAQVYAVDYKRHYPDRPHARGNGSAKDIAYEGADDRNMLGPYMNLNGMLICPLSPGGADFEAEPNAPWISSSYYLFFGAQYIGNAGMIRMGDRFEFANARYNILACDGDEAVLGEGAYTSHPDREGLMVAQRAQNERLLYAFGPYTFTRWVFGSPSRPPIDTQHVAGDGSVDRYTQVAWDEAARSDSRVDQVPIYTESTDTVANYTNIPRGSQ